MSYKKKAVSSIIGSVGQVMLALLLGFLAYGLSIYFYVSAQSIPVADNAGNGAINIE